MPDRTLEEINVMNTLTIATKKDIPLPEHAPIIEEPEDFRDFVMHDIPRMIDNGVDTAVYNWQGVTIRVNIDHKTKSGTIDFIA